MKRWMMAVSLGLLALGAAAAGKVREDKGLQQGQPGMNRWNDAEPGTTTKLARAYGMAPPQVPHGVGSFAITRESNPCMDCHAEGLELGEGHAATKVPPSHFREGKLAGMRYQCLQCHSPRAVGAAPPAAVLK